MAASVANCGVRARHPANRYFWGFRGKLRRKATLSGNAVAIAYDDVGRQQSVTQLVNGNPTVTLAATGPQAQYKGWNPVTAVTVATTGVHNEPFSRAALFGHGACWVLLVNFSNLDRAVWHSIFTMVRSALYRFGGLAGGCHSMVVLKQQMVSLLPVVGSALRGSYFVPAGIVLMRHGRSESGE